MFKLCPVDSSQIEFCRRALSTNDFCSFFLPVYNAKDCDANWFCTLFSHSSPTYFLCVTLLFFSSCFSLRYNGGRFLFFFSSFNFQIEHFQGPKLNGPWWTECPTMASLRLTLVFVKQFVAICADYSIFALVGTSNNIETNTSELLTVSIFHNF